MSWRVESWRKGLGWQPTGQYYLPRYEGCDPSDEVRYPAIDISRNEAVWLASRLRRHSGMFRFRVRRAS